MARRVRPSAARRALLSGVAGALAALVLALAPVTLAADHSIDIVGFAFSPRSTTVGVGDTVTWANSDAQGHTATADDGTFDTGTISGNGSKSVTLTKAGTFAYHCRIHTNMTATLVVAAAASAPPTDTVADSPAGRAGLGGGVGLVVIATIGLAVGLRRFRRVPAPR